MPEINLRLLEEYNGAPQPNLFSSFAKAKLLINLVNFPLDSWQNKYPWGVDAKKKALIPPQNTQKTLLHVPHAMGCTSAPRRYIASQQNATRHSFAVVIHCNDN